MSELVGNLNTEFPRGTDDDGLDILSILPESFQNRNAKGTGFTCAGRGFGNDIAPLPHGGNGFGLYRRGGGKPHAVNCPQQSRA